jgi:protein SCO1
MSDQPPASERSPDQPDDANDRDRPTTAGTGDDNQPPAHNQSRGNGLRIALAVLVLAVIAGGVALLVSGSDHSSKAQGANEASYAGLTLSPAKPEPALDLRDYLGQRVNIANLRGKALLVTFLYTHCTTDCPLIASDLHTALTLMGPKNAAKVQLLAVSVDPRGDNPTDVAHFLAVHQLTGHMLYLLGSAHELGKTWEAWGVGSERDASNPETINHTALVYGITASGQIATIYSASMKPSEVAHDVPLLANG